jgi:hypothetical protein
VVGVPVSAPVALSKIAQTGMFFMVKLNSPPSAAEVAGLKKYGAPMATAVAGSPLMVREVVIVTEVPAGVALVGLPEELALPPPPHPASKAARQKPRKYRVAIPHPHRRRKTHPKNPVRQQDDDLRAFRTARAGNPAILAL